MRLWALFLLELAAFSGSAAALMMGARAYRPSLPPQPESARADRKVVSDNLLRPHVPEIAQSAAATFLGMSDELLVERMRKAEVRSLRFNRGGSSISFRIDFADGSRASFKPTQINPQSVPRKEVAAYRLSRLLGLSVVAPAAMREISREDILGKLAPESLAMRPRIDAETIFEEGMTRGALSYWIPTIVNMGLDSTEGINRWTSWLTVGVPIPPDKVGLMAQLSSLLLFDLVQNNSDRWSGGNVMGSPDGKVLYFMDNAFGFQADAVGHKRCLAYLSRAQKFSRRFVAALRQLDRPSIVKALAEEPGPPLLSDAEIDALLSRRDQAIRYVDQTLKRFGEAEVLVFP